MRLPIRLGGCGLTSMLAVAPAAHVGSWLQTLGAVEAAVGTRILGDDVPMSPSTAALQQAVATLPSRDSLPTWRDVATRPVRQAQRALTKAIHDKEHARWLATAPPVAQARLQACTGTGAETLFTAIPTEAAFSLSNEDMALALRMRLGQALLHGWCARCGQHLDRPGFHASACRGNSSIRHNRLRDLLYTILHEAGYAAYTEQEEPTLRHRPDIRMESGLAPTTTYLDVHIFNPTVPSQRHTLNAASPDAANLREWQAKLRRDYEPLPERPGFALLPAVVTSFGSWHPQTIQLLRSCARTTASAGGHTPATPDLAKVLARRWLTRLSLQVHRENASMLRRCAPQQLQTSGLDRPWSEEDAPLWLLPALHTEAGDS
jgi:hypothetical protein